MWNNQQNNMSKRFKAVVWFYDHLPIKSQTYKAFLSDEKKGTAVTKLRDRIINKLVAGKYKTAIIYDNGAEVERWKEGVLIINN